MKTKIISTQHSALLAMSSRDAGLHSSAESHIPAIGSEWPSQGGINGGLVPARAGVPAHYLIIAKDDTDDCSWGASDKKTNATSKWNGAANTALLLKENCPAAKIASQYIASGHANFYLPACGEIYSCYMNAPETFKVGQWYWSSTQSSETTAFIMNFLGYQYIGEKYKNLRIRPVRRMYI